LALGSVPVLAGRLTTHYANLTHRVFVESNKGWV
jgi:hypothetical protein